MPVTKRSGHHSRRAFSLVEVVVTMTILGVIAALLMPKLRTSFAASTRHSARRQALSSLYRAQATAVQYSRRSWLVRSGNTLKVIVDSSGTTVQRGSMLDLNKSFGATLTATPSDTIAFDPRGFAVLTGSTPKLVVTVSSTPGADTVCVTGLSRIVTSACP
jgi:prepilin-type N-terminal cleavage/methylation domain-containing protein